MKFNIFVILLLSSPLHRPIKTCYLRFDTRDLQKLESKFPPFGTIVCLVIFIIVTISNKFTNLWPICHLVLLTSNLCLPYLHLHWMVPEVPLLGALPYSIVYFSRSRKVYIVLGNGGCKKIKDFFHNSTYFLEWRPLCWKASNSIRSTIYCEQERQKQLLIFV